MSDLKPHDPGYHARKVGDMRPALEVAKARIAEAHKDRAIGCYVHRGNFGIEEVRCKCCGTPVRRLMPHPDFSEERLINGQRVWVQAMTLGTCPEYTEVMMDFDDGSRHVTVVCQDCSKHLTLEQCEWLYCGDMEEWMVDGEHASEGFWEKQSCRTIVNYKAYPPGVVAV